MRNAPAVAPFQARQGQGVHVHRVVDLVRTVTAVMFAWMMVLLVNSLSSFPTCAGNS